MKRHHSEKRFILNNMATLQLDFLVEVISKALCFEHYAAKVNASDPEDIDIELALKYYEEREDSYIYKATSLLIMAEQSDELLQETFH